MMTPNVEQVVAMRRHRYRNTSMSPVGIGLEPGNSMAFDRDITKTGRGKFDLMNGRRSVDIQ